MLSPDLVPATHHPDAVKYRVLGNMPPESDWLPTRAGEGWEGIAVDSSPSVTQGVAKGSGSGLRELVDSNKGPRWLPSSQARGLDSTPAHEGDEHALSGYDRSDDLLAAKVKAFQFRTYSGPSKGSDWDKSTRVVPKPSDDDTALPKSRSTNRTEDSRANVTDSMSTGPLGAFPNTTVRKHRFRSFKDGGFKITLKSDGIGPAPPLAPSTPEERLARFRAGKSMPSSSLAKPPGSLEGAQQDKMSPSRAGSTPQPSIRELSRADRLAARLAEAAGVDIRRTERQQRASVPSSIANRPITTVPGKAQQIGIEASATSRRDSAASTLRPAEESVSGLQTSTGEVDDIMQSRQDLLVSEEPPSRPVASPRATTPERIELMEKQYIVDALDDWMEDNPGQEAQGNAEWEEEKAIVLLEFDNTVRQPALNPSPEPVSDQDGGEDSRL